MKAFLVGLLAFTGVLKGCMLARFAYLGVPGFVLKGEPVWLDCGYDLEDDELYSVKWYKDNVEFYRYLPSDRPSAQKFKLDGVFLDIRHSNATHAFLYTSEMETEGEYSCEVSTEIPTFRTYKASKELYVYVIPDGEPAIFGVQRRYSIGTEVNITCEFGPSKPAAELTWYINGEKAPLSYVRHKQTHSYSDDLKICESRLVFVVDPSHLQQDNLSFQCTASVSLIYSKRSLELKITDGEPGAEFQHVPHLPPGLEGPSITGSVPRYYVGSTVDVNCSSARSLELAVLQWYVNDEEVKPEFLSYYLPTKYADGLVSTKLGLHFQVQEEHFKSEEMRLKCTATLAKNIKMSTEEKIPVGPNKASGYQTSDHSNAGKKYVTEILVQYLVVCVCTLLAFHS